MSLKKLVVFVVSIALTTTLLLSFVSPAFAANSARGGKLFSANCAACHAGGRNLVVAQKNLTEAALKKYLKGYSDDEVGAIAYQIINGKGAMPAYGNRLKPDFIEDIAQYVNEQAKSGW